MLRRLRLQRFALAFGLFYFCLSASQEAHAQEQCVTFGEARRSGLFAQFQLRPAGLVKNEVEARTGGKVVSFLICRPGPSYRLTVLHPGGNVVTLSVPAR